MRIIFILLFLIVRTWAGDSHDWQTITTMNDVKDLAVTNGQIWAATTGGIFSYDTSTASVQRYTNLDGLHSVLQQAVVADEHQNIICGGYQGIIDVFNVSSNRWTGLYALEGNPVSDLYVRNDTLWVAAGKGLAVFIWKDGQYVFQDYFLNFNVFPAAVYSVILYAQRVWIGTDVGLLSAPADLSRYTINDPALWKKITTGSGLPDNTIYDLEIAYNKLYMGTGHGIASIDGSFQIQVESNWIKYKDGTYLPVNHLALVDKKLYVSFSRYIYSLDNTHHVLYYLSASSTIQSLVSDGRMHLWFAQKNYGLQRSDWQAPYVFEDPYTNFFRRVYQTSGGSIVATSGGPGAFNYPNGFYIFDRKWTNYRFLGTHWYAIGNADMVYEDRFNNLWIGSWGGGIMVFKQDGQQVFLHSYPGDGQMVTRIGSREETVPLADYPVYSGFFSGVRTHPNYEVITSMKEDYDGNLWLSVYYAGNDRSVAIAPYTANGFISLDSTDWIYFGKDDGIKTSTGGILCMTFDDYGRVWLGTDMDGVYILDYNHTLKDKSDDRLSHLGIDDNLYSNRILSLATDQDGVVWIGTASGLSSYDGVNVYKHVGDPQGLNGPLENQINDIFVDKYNNKWFATTGGVSILRAEHSPWDKNAWLGYNRENSGLVDNSVQSIFVNNKTSQVLIGTDNGMSVYYGSFVQIQDDFKKMIGGPNPFILSEKTVKFTITHLMKNSTVKIFSINGTLIRRLSPEKKLTDGTLQVDGSRAYWDGRDRNGYPVQSGIYLFFAYSEDGKAKAGKIAVIRK